MASNDEDRRGGRVVLSLFWAIILLGGCTSRPNLKVVTLSDIWNINDGEVCTECCTYRSRTPNQPEAGISRTREVWVVENKWSVFET
jgi:hypothetical protein